MKLDIIDLDTNKSLKIVDAPIDFEYVDNDNVEIYCIGAIYKINLSKLREEADDGE